MRRLRQLEGEDAAEELVAERDLIIDVMKEVAAKKCIYDTPIDCLVLPGRRTTSVRLLRLHQKP